MADDLHDKGMAIRRKVLGDAYVDQATANIDDFNRDFQRMVTEYCWGSVWGREGLSHKQRSLNNLCLLAALNRPHELEVHVAAQSEMAAPWKRSARRYSRWLSTPAFLPA